MGGLIAVGAWDGREYVGDTRRLLLFEPQAGPFEQLKANTARNPHTILVNVALGAMPGTATMFRSDPDYSSSLLRPKDHLDLMPQIKFDGQEEQVRVSTLDLIMAGYGLGGYDEMVVDVQGYELEVFKGAVHTLTDIDRIVCEVNTAEVYEGCAQMEDIDTFLAPRFRRTETDLHGGVWGDAVYTSV